MEHFHTIRVRRVDRCSGESYFVRISQKADVAVAPFSPTGRAGLMGLAPKARTDELAVLLAGEVPGSLRDAYQCGHPLLDWVIATYPRAGDVWERLIRYAVSRAAEVQAGRLSLERYRGTLDAIARDPKGRGYGRRATCASPVSPADMERFPAERQEVKVTESLGPDLVAYVSAAVGWELPGVIGDLLEESTDLLVDLACQVARTRGDAFDMGALVDRATWGRWRASSVLGHLPDRTRRSRAHRVRPSQGDRFVGDPSDAYRSC
jgi:hypothetical protein